MKSVKMLTLTAAFALIASGIAVAAPGEGKPKDDRPRGDRGPGPMMEHLLPPRLVQDLDLDASQKAKLDELTAAFKKDVEKWRSENPRDPETMRQAREARDRDAFRKMAEARKPLMEKRKGYVDQLRQTLSAEQNKKLDDHFAQMRERRGEGRGGPPPPPED